MRTVTKNWIILLVSVCMLLISSCSLEIPEDPNKFLYNFQGQTFRQIKYRSIEDNNVYKLHSGVRDLAFAPNEYSSTFQNYTELSLVPCYGTVKGTYRFLEKEDFLAEVNDTGVDQTDSNNDGVYDIFEPYGPEEVPDEAPQDRVDLVEYFIVIDINSNSVTAGCPITTNSKLYYQFLFYQKGDLILRDYNREIEFFLRPFSN